MLWLMALFSFAAVAAAGWAVARPPVSRVREALTTAPGSGQRRGPLSPGAWMAMLIAHWEGLAEQAGLGLSRQGILAALVGANLLGLLLIAGRERALGVGLLAAVWALPPVLVRYGRRRRAEAFVRQLPAALQLMANTVRAGGTLLQAVRSVGSELPAPAGEEFRRVYRTMQLQVSAAVAMEQLRQRVGAREVTAVVVACKVACEAGADLSAVLENIAREIQEDRQFLQAMRAASAEGRMSARIVTLVPLIFSALIHTFHPNYFPDLLGQPGGASLLLGSLVAILTGWLLISRICDLRNW